MLGWSWMLDEEGDCESVAWPWGGALVVDWGQLRLNLDFVLPFHVVHRLDSSSRIG